MIEQLIQMAGQQLAPQLQQFGISEAQVSGILEQAKQSFSQGIKSEAGAGNFAGLLDVFNGGNAAAGNNIASSISSDFVGNLVSKLGLSPAVASSVSGMIIPLIMQKFSGSETGTAQDAGDLMSKLGMDNDDMISGALKGFLGGNKDAEDLLGGISKLF
ncbi:MAG: hypothetical protein MUE33_03165 [Cytophagaceae bacterium]|jgi:hypothetical protein|nr:hypothetical protein [Cytophagaceae bacterium]